MCHCVCEYTNDKVFIKLFTHRKMVKRGYTKTQVCVCGEVGGGGGVMDDFYFLLPLFVSLSDYIV